MSRYLRLFSLTVAVFLFATGFSAGLFAADKAENKNVKLGPVETGITGGIIVSYTDNLGLSEFDEESDWSIAPYIGFNLLFPMSFSRYFDLGIDGNIGFTQYADQSHVSAGLTGHTGVAFDFMIGNWKLNVHDRYLRSITPDHEEQPWVTHMSEFVSWNNVAGLAATYEFNRLKFSTGYDYTWYRVEKTSEVDDYKRTNRDAQTYFVDLAFAANPRTDIFTRWTHEDSFNKRHYYNDSASERIDLGLRGQITPRLTGQISAGYEDMNFDHNGTGVADTDDFDGFVYNASLHHIISNITSHSLAFSYKPDYGYATGNFYKYFSATYSLSHNFCQRLSGTAFYSYDNLKESGATTQSEEADRNSVGFGLTYLLTPKTDLSFNYDFINRDSDRHGKDYKVNNLSVALRHNF